MADQEARKQFNIAVEAIKKTPDDLARWDEVEALAESLNCPDEVVSLYKYTLSQKLSAELAGELGERGAAFTEEWFGDDPGVVRGLLLQVMDLNPEADWAFQRLTESFTLAESWDELLALYDRVLTATRDPERLVQLLDEAAQVAKDIAGQPDKAIRYLQQLVPLKRDDAQLEASLERLLERHERWVDLIELWQSKLPQLDADERDQRRARIATCWLDNLDDPGKALEAVKPLLAEPREDDRAACELLERIVTFPTATSHVRHSALDLLRLHYEATSRPREIVRVLETAIEISTPAESLSLREEAGARLAALEEDVAAMNHYAALLALDPAHAVVQERMKSLARRSGEFARYAEGIALAASSCEDVPRKVALLAEAARIRLDMLEDEESAIELFQAALAQDGLPPDEEQRVSRRLAELLARAERPGERLKVLERLARIETTPSTKKAVVGEAARLAESLGEVDRALDLWQSRIDADPDDLFALDAKIGLLESNERWQPLIECLGLRVGKTGAESQKRIDLVRVAMIYDQKLAALGQAIDAWLRVQEECGENAETVDAMADLLTRTERWPSLAELLERASSREIARVTERLLMLSDAYRAHLDAPDRALNGYRNALLIDSRNETARAGLTALLDVAGCSSQAAEALAAAYRDNQEWSRFLELLEPRLHSARDRREQLQMLREAAEIQESRLDDADAALTSLARALPMAPTDRGIEGNLLRLAAATGRWEVAAVALSQAAAAVAGEPYELSRLRFAEGSVLDERLGRPAEACDAFLAVLTIEPGNLAAAQAATRLGTRLGRWDQVAAAVVACVRERNAIEASLIHEIALVAGQRDSYDQAVAALGRALDAISLAPRHAFELHRVLAIWNRDRRGDAAAAAASFARALACDPVHAGVLREQAALQRSRPGRALFDTLKRLGDADPGDLDVAHEAARLALEHIDDRREQLDALTTLMARASAAWRGTSEASGRLEASTYVRWALDRLIAHYLAAGQPSAAVDLLIDATRLPFDGDARRAMRHRAAEIAAEVMGQPNLAIEMYRGVLTQVPDDAVALHKLAALYDAEDRHAENLTLKRLQLAVEREPAQRLHLRLEVARLVGLVVQLGGREEALRDNLRESPGHMPSVDALSAIIEARGEHHALLALFEDQARQVEERHDKVGAAALWSRVAQVAEHHTQEPDRAIAAYRRVVELAPTPAALRALAELYVGRNQPGMAVPWLESLLAAVPAAERPPVVHQLARAHLGARQVDRAIACLESHIDARTPAPELRALLMQLYREGESWERLAALLTDSLPQVTDREQAIAFAREAADIYTTTLGSPNRALPALEKALSHLPGDRILRTQLGMGLRTAGRLDEARELFLELIEEFGRRRSPERATVHVELALVYQALGENDKALVEMETASKMDTGNIAIQKALAELARQAGNMEKAERTYRSLLLVVRRKAPADLDAVGPSEVLYELHKLALQRNEADQARELLESALETAVQSDDEVRRLRRSLLAHGEAETLLRVIDLRLEVTEEQASRAELLANKADVLHDALGRTGEALEALLDALRLEPMRDDLHGKARALAGSGPGVTTYTSAVVEIADSLRRREDPPIVAHLLMRAGDALEHDAGDLRGALALYKRVEELGERKAEAYYAIARVAGATNDTEEQARVLEAMLALATAEEPSHAQIDALYRLAEIFVGNPDRCAQGVELLEQAFAAEPRYAQAGRILKLAAAAEPQSARVMTLYERVARAGNSWEMLLDFLERRAGLPAATPGQVREAVNVAVERGQHERAQALLARAVEAARSSPEGLQSAGWAVAGLAERHIDTGELDKARDLIHEIAGFADAADVSRLALELARTARRSDKGLAADMYEFLRQRDPLDRRVWEPLVELYRELGDSERLQAVIAATLPTLTDPSERNALRMQHARYLLDTVEHGHEAIDVLREVLYDDPDHKEAGALLEDILRQSGNQDALADFLWQRFEDARARGSTELVIDVAGRLGALLDSMGSSEALSVYRAALEAAPQSRELLRIVLDHMDASSDLRERAELFERLIAVEEPERGADLAVQLCMVYEQLGDADGYQRALELGYRANPDDAHLRQRLETWYRDAQKWVSLAELMTEEAERTAARTGDIDAAVARLREAAAVHRDTLFDMRAAAEVLKRARRLAPTNDHLVAELAACLNAGGDPAGAIAAIGEALEQGIQGTARVDLLLLRSDLHMTTADEGTALQDLDEAYRLDPARIRPQLIQGLDSYRMLSQARGDQEAERASTLRLAQLLAEAREHDQLRALLHQWIEREPGDREPLYLLRDMDRAADNWEGVAAACARLVALEQGDAQAQAALELAEAAELAGRPGDAQSGLEMVHHAQPENERIRDRLRRIYELAGAFREFAAVLLADGDHATDPAVRYDAYRRAAEVLLHQLQDPAAASAPARKALDIKPDEHEALVLYIDILIISGQTGEATRILEPAINEHKRRSPQLAELQQRMARVAAATGDRDSQLGWLKKAFDVDRKSGEIASDLAQLATTMGDYELALKPLRAITLMENPGPITRVMALLWEAKIEHARGNKAKAELWAKKALREDPEYQDAKEFLDQISN